MATLFFYVLALTTANTTDFFLTSTKTKQQRLVILNALLYILGIKVEHIKLICDLLT